MTSDKFPLLQRILKTIGLSTEAIDEIISRIIELLSEGKEAPQASEPPPYHLHDNFLTMAEHSFFKVLQQAVSDWAIVCPKVSLADLFYAKSSDLRMYRTYTNKIDRKHIDFLLCDLHTAKPLLGIELDDKSHQRQDRRMRDEFVASVFGAAHLPLVRMPTQHGYSIQQLRGMLRDSAKIGALASATEPAAPMPPSEPDPPRCPLCNSPMVLRKAKRGSNIGQSFWGCPNYPRCHGVLNPTKGE